MDYIYIVAGLIMLFIGGEGLVRGSVSLAEKLGISKLLIGLTVVGFGTSTPEFLVSMQAALANQSEIAVGNVVGSNIANILLILGLSAVIYPLVSEGKAIKRDSIFMVISTVLLMLVAFLGIIPRGVGVIFVALLIVYIVYAYLEEKKQTASLQGNLYTHETEDKETPLSPPLAIGAVGLGLLMLVFGADMLIKGAVSIATSFGIPEAVIGLTLVAVGTSLPELATSVVAALKKQTDVAIGNIIGSNFFNILFILGVTSLVLPVPIDSHFTSIDIPIALAVAAVLSALIVWKGRIGRVTGAVFLLAYLAYTLFIFISGRV